MENENVDEVDEPLGLLPGEEEENVEGSGRQRGGGGADGAFDGRPLPSLRVVEDQSGSNEAAGAAVDEGPGGQRGGGGADAAFDGRPLPGQQVQEDQAEADRERGQGGDLPLVQPMEGEGWMERVQGWMARVEQVEVEPYVPPMPMEVMEELVQPYVPQMVTRPFP